MPFTKRPRPWAARTAARPGARRYVLQQYRPTGTLLDGNFQKAIPYPEATLNKIARELQPFLTEIDVRV
ncbi:hypothetical protein [Moorella sulfitireducens (nom. illeg.)]|uniref:hypothetical protein n=1 Tax=Neomoorella sulfitireducens TaxID=2972948 RepID=UPI0021AC3887|nr:hypothetical protein [Moorella sulfitireducens]